MRKTLAIMLVFMMIFSYSTAIFAEKGSTSIQIIGIPPAPTEEPPAPEVKLQGIGVENFEVESWWDFSPSNSELRVNDSDIKKCEETIIEAIPKNENENIMKNWEIFKWKKTNCTKSLRNGDP